MNNWVKTYTLNIFGQADKKKFGNKNFEMYMNDAYCLAELKMLEVVESTLHKYQDSDMELSEFRCHIHELMALKLKNLKNNKNPKAILDASLSKVIELTTAKDLDKLKTSCEWSKILLIDTDIVILDPDGWNRTNYDHSFNRELISSNEFSRRVSISTCNFKVDSFNVLRDNVNRWEKLNDKGKS